MYTHTNISSTYMHIKIHALMYNILYNTLSMIYTHKHIHNQMKKKYTITVFISVTEQHGYSYYL